MNTPPFDLRDNITFVLQKAFSLTTFVLGVSRVTDTAPTETSLAIARIIIGGVLLAIAAIAEVLMWRSQRAGAARSGAMSDGAEDRLGERMHLLERALIDRLPPTVD